MNNDEKELNRKLSEKEEIRLQQFNKMLEEYRDKGYKDSLHTISIKKANIVGLIITVPVFVVFYALYYLINGLKGFDNFSLPQLFVAFISIFVLIVVHELLHGLSWGLFCQNKYRSIEFGLIKEYMTPYCCCKEPLKKVPYLLGCGMPLFVLGIMMAVIAIACQSGLWLFVAANNTISAIGDIMVMIEVIKHKGNDDLFIDHPCQAGFVSISKM